MARISEIIQTGLSLWPVRKDKTPLTVGSKTWIYGQSAKLTNQADFKDAFGIAIICGAISGNVVCIDIDCKYDVTGALYDTLAGEMPENIFNRFTVQRTTSGGYHFWFKIDGVVPQSGKLAMRPATDSELKEYNDKAREAGQRVLLDANKKPKTLIEIKGEGGYAIINPTPKYDLIQGDFLNLQTISNSEFNSVIEICKKFNLVNEAIQEHKPKQKTDYVSLDDTTAWDDYNNRHSALEILQQYGWKEGRQTSRGLEVKHFSTDKGKSGILNPTQTAVFVHSESTPLPTGRWHTAYSIFCYYEHNGDFSNAAKDLISKGYGTKRISQQATFTQTTVTQQAPTTQQVKQVKGFIAGHFRPLGFDKSEDGVQAFYFHVAGCQMPIRLTVSKMTAHNLMMLAPLSYWKVKYPKPEKSRSVFDVESAIEDLISISNEVGFYSGRNIRGRGAWIDEDRTVIHFGDKLLIDWESGRLTDIESKYIYEIAQPLHIGYEKPLSTKESIKLIEIITRLNWENESDAFLLAGWIYIAPICGILKWRPHIWITGESGTGKSTVFRDIVRKMLGDCCLAVQGGSSEAGIREEIKYDSIPVVYEEAEENKQHLGKDMMSSVLDYIRASSADDTGTILKGTGSGAKKFNPRAIFALCSIVPQMTSQADRRRITMLNLVKKAADLEWSETQEMIIRTLTPEYAERFQAMAVQNIPVFLQSLSVIKTELAIYLKDTAMSDQLSPLVAGAWHILNEDIITPEYAKSWFEKMKLENKVDEYLPDHLQAIRKILGYEVRLDFGATKTIAELINMAKWGISSVEQSNGLTDSDVRIRLGRYGIRYENDFIYISNTNPAIGEILKDTPWSKNHSDIFKRITGAEVGKNVKYFSASDTSRYVCIPYGEIIKSE
jgi:hypothetical protein